MINRLQRLREQVAREAAMLLYSGQEKEYKQAKEKAARILGARILPSNLEVAKELDAIAEQNEGQLRRERLIQMRKDALRVMGILQDFHPRLIGSVWRGTAHKNSDIDIVVFSDNSETVLKKLKENGLKITRIERYPALKQHDSKTLHIYIILPSGNEGEVVVRSLEEANSFEKCEIYGDAITGLDFYQLKKVLEENPAKRFIPFSDKET